MSGKRLFTGAVAITLAVGLFSWPEPTPSAPEGPNHCSPTITVRCAKGERGTQPTKDPAPDPTPRAHTRNT